VSVGYPEFGPAADAAHSPASSPGSIDTRAAAPSRLLSFSRKKNLYRIDW
jgi:hypothetical protein